MKKTIIILVIICGLKNLAFGISDETVRLVKLISERPDYISEQKALDLISQPGAKDTVFIKRNPALSLRHGFQISRFNFESKIVSFEDGKWVTSSLIVSKPSSRPLVIFILFCLTPFVYIFLISGEKTKNWKKELTDEDGSFDKSAQYDYQQDTLFKLKTKFITWFFRYQFLMNSLVLADAYTQIGFRKELFVMLGAILLFDLVVYYLYRNRFKRKLEYMNELEKGFEPAR